MKASAGCSWIVWELFHAAAGMVREAGLTVASDALAQPAVGTEMLQVERERGGTMSTPSWFERAMHLKCKLQGCWGGCPALPHPEPAANLSPHLIETSAVGWLVRARATEVALALPTATTPGDSSACRVA